MHNIDLMVITKESFPQGGAATNRIISYAVPLSSSYNVKVFTLYPTKYNSSIDIPSFGNVDALYYEYVGKASSEKNARLLKRSLDRLKKRIRLFSIIRKERPKSIIYVARDMHLAIQLRLLSVLFKYRLFREISESPEYISCGVKRGFITQLYRLFDGMIVITKGIRDYFHFIPDKQFFHLPMTVDTNRFEIPSQIIGNYFFYCSGGNSQRDGLLDIVKGFSIFSEKDSGNHHLILATVFDDKNEYDQNVKKIISNNPSINHIGLVSSDKIPGLMKSAVALLITPHQDYKTRGFPTKLGEYLASGRPVICSSISTLTNELDNDSVVFVSPNNPQSIADAMQKLIATPELADSIGRRGEEFVKEHFAAQLYVKDLELFLGL